MSLPSKPNALVCDEQGLIGKELFAVDGCKLPSNASRTWSGTHADLAKSADDVLRRQQGQRQLSTNRDHESPDR